MVYFLSYVLLKTICFNDKFIFNKWHYIVSNNIFSRKLKLFFGVLRNILKDQPYVALAFMTGVLPINKYSSSSALNRYDSKNKEQRT